MRRPWAPGGSASEQESGHPTFPQERLERIVDMPQERLSDVHFPSVMGEIGEVVRLISQERFQQRTVEETVVAQASQTQEMVAGVKDYGGASVGGYQPDAMLPQHVKHLPPHPTPTRNTYSTFHI